MDCKYQTFAPNSIHLDCGAANAVTVPAADPDWALVSFHWGAYAVGGIVAFFVLRALLRSAFFIVRQQTVVVVERLGRYRCAKASGLRVKIPLLDKIAVRMQLRVMQLAIEADTKTKDNVFVDLHVAVQHRVIPEKAADAWYRLQEPEKQMTAFVLDRVRAIVPTMTLDQAFEHKDAIAEGVKTSLMQKMADYGYEITDVAVTQIDPDDGVKKAMNEIQTQTRLQEAAKAKGEANKILVVKAAEAEAESKQLQGQGVANERLAIVEGLKRSVEALKGVEGVPVDEALKMVLVTQYFDTLKSVGSSANAKVIMMPVSPSGVLDIETQIRNAVLVADAASARS